mmetsp:Transcript_17928/g.37065  ORF Transcript_17928/g.37065 Transcript_17928/m.37065 type:complete len:341 (-) Transcript_17928:1197-2219(-)|eukprot:CAMPEP_0172453472 /NCGR_PEP_ID=MMETSP1065-20121228/10775_1 /TAXON_ID=265537 /ORGANISM="Amphiprora paludosa, Strain CCMP125" /LENGTH=340 /DNA_ID=CAMNT_0013205655 /DNA_START=80 /DNA_END=1102 /DNA_ORIENTATION=+
MSKSPSLRRIQADVRELAFDPSDQYHAAPLESDMFEWHFTIRGAKGTDFEGGIYHGRILLPPDYPFKPPHIMFLTPSGRFETNTKVCLSFSAYHPELWQPAWGIRLILEALISFLPTPADGAIGALDWSAKERKRLAQKSVDWCCPSCGKVKDLIPELKCQPVSGDDDKAASTGSPAKQSRFAKEIEELRRLQMLEHKKDEEEKDENKKEEEKTEEVETPAEAEEEDEPSSSEVVVVEEKDNIVEEESSHNNPEVEEADDEKLEEIPTMPEETTAVEPPVAMPAPIQQPQAAPVVSSGAWWMLDPLLQLIIVVLSAICYILFRKTQALCAELMSLEERNF